MKPNEKTQTAYTSEKTGIVVTVDRYMCKGCTLCAEICPVKCLEMVTAPDKWEGAYVVVSDIDACTGCLLCEIQCPDFAIDIYSPKKEKKKEKAEA